MIETTKVKITKAQCDSCQKNILEKLTGETNHALLQGYFGYGSDLDGEHFSFHLCSKCTRKIVKSLGIKVDWPKP